MKRKKIHRVIAPLIGFAAFVWFLIRVIPKPSRAAYPCQRAAFPLAAGFITWLTTIAGSWLLVKRIRKLQSLPGTLKIILMIVPISAAFTVLVINTDSPLIAKTTENFSPIDGPNEPIGKGRGIFPGRVVWINEPEATNWDGSGKWWEKQNTDYDMVSKMLERSIIELTGENDLATAWDLCFKYFRERQGKTGGYTQGEKIAVKLNLNNTNNHTNWDNRSNSSPQMVLAIADHLVNIAGVPDTCITFYDASRPIAGPIFDTVSSAFPGIKFVDNIGGNGRYKYKVDYSAKLDWSQARTIELGGGYPTYLPECVSKADYLINLGNLKGHNLAGVTICAKNHFGTFYSYSEESPSHSPPKAAGVHPYIAVHEMRSGTHWNFDKREMGSYNALVDIMGHKHLGEKTLLFLVDGLYASRNQYESLSDENKWESSPFNGSWTSSLFASFDGVAIESVCVDFLRSEHTMNEVYGNVDNYLHEAALADNPPSSTFYDPNGDGAGLPSLGVHEHWNNPDEKKYSRNLGSDEGIELVIGGISGTAAEPPGSLQAYPDYDNQNILLLWSGGGAGAEEYIVERAENEPLDFIEIARLKTSSTFYIDAEISPDVNYFYRMRSKGMFGEGNPGDTVTALVLGFDEIKASGFVIYPNPASDFITIKHKAAGSIIQSISIYNLSAKLIRTINPGNHPEIIKLSVQDLHPGQYIFRIQTDKGSVNKRVLKN